MWKHRFYRINRGLRRARLTGSHQMPLYSTAWMKFAETHSQRPWGLKKCTCYRGPPRAPVAWNDCFSLANYNDWPRWWELNSLSLSTTDLFRFMGGDGGETKPCTLDVLNNDTGLPVVPICGASFAFCTRLRYVHMSAWVWCTCSFFELLKIRIFGSPPLTT
jgi:hypothetical protein